MGEAETCAQSQELTEPKSDRTQAQGRAFWSTETDGVGPFLSFQPAVGLGEPLYLSVSRSLRLPDPSSCCVYGDPSRSSHVLAHSGSERPKVVSTQLALG